MFFTPILKTSNSTACTLFLGWCSCLFIAASLVGCTSTEPDENKIIKNRAKPLGDENLSDIRADAARANAMSQQRNPFPLPDEISKEELLNAIRQLAISERMQMSEVNYTYLQITRAEAGHRLIENVNQLSDGERLIAITARLDALMKLRAISHPNAEKDLREMATKYENVKQENVAVVSNIALLKLELSDRLIESPDQLQPFFDEVRALIKKYPANSLLAESMESIVAGLFQQQQRGAAIQMMRLLVEEFADSSRRDVKNVGKRMNDFVYLAELNYEGILIDLQEQRPGVDEAYESMIQKILEKNTYSIETFREIQKSFRLLEVFNKYELAKRINVMLEESVKKHPDRNVAKVVSFELAMSNRRLNQVDQPIKVDASDWEGKLFDWEYYREKIVVVIFWSTQSPQSIETLDKLRELKPNFKNSGFDVLAINVDVNPIELEKYFKEQYDIVVLSSNQTGDLGRGNDFSAKFGIRELPYLMLVDRDGIVREINLHTEEIRTTITRYLSK